MRTPNPDNVKATKTSRALTQLAVVNAKPKEKPYKLADKQGLFLYITPAGGKSWRYKYRFQGKEKLLVIGPFPEITLAEARDKHFLARKSLANGLDPSEEKQKQYKDALESANRTFEKCAEEWMSRKLPSLSEKNAKHIESRIRNDLITALGKKPIHSITSRNLIDVLQTVEARGANEVARRLKQYANDIFRFARVMGYITRNPAEEFDSRDVLVSYKKGHFSAIAADEIPTLIKAIELNKPRLYRQTVLAVKLMMMTFVRTGELAVLNSLSNQQKPNLPNKPDNETFLREVFRGMPEEQRAMVVSFNGAPSEAPKKEWGGKPWVKNLVLGASNNNYFAISSYAKDETGQFRRRKANFQGLYAIMLDDIGSKVPMSKLVLEPSWLLETSPGNHQAGYLLAAPITDAHEADQLVKALLDEGNGDTGAGGPTARLARLPVGANGKHTPAFPTHLKVWKPELRYTPAAIIEAFQLKLGQKAQSKKASSKLKAMARDEIFLSAPANNPVIAALKSHGLYKKSLGAGKHDITCPKCHEHRQGLSHR